MPIGWEVVPATFTTQTARQLGVHPRDLYRLRDVGDIIELSRGVFRRADAPPATYPDLLAVAYRAPRAVVCCVSAAAVYDLTDELPAATQIAVPKRDRPPRISYPPTEIFRFDEDAFELGLSSLEAAEGEDIRVYGPERTVVDLMRLRHRLGEQLAYEALRRYLRSRGAKPSAVLRLAAKLGVEGPVRLALDTVGTG
jgi:predicted transcriptional regulator of viral defense system